MERSKRAYWILGASLLALLAVVVYVIVVSNGGDSGVERHSALLDEAAQSPPVQDAFTYIEMNSGKTETSTSEASEESVVQESTETDERSDEYGGYFGEEAARAYDAEGGKGDPPKAWKKDYSHWDSAGWEAQAPFEEVGVLQRKPSNARIRMPTEEDTQRMDEIGQELAEAVLKGLASPVPIPGYVHRIPEEGKNVYISPGFLERYDALTQEIAAIDKRSMKESSELHSYRSTPFLTHFWPTDSPVFAIEYHRRSSDGSLMRVVTTPSDGKTRRWVAGPPPDLSGFSKEEVEIMKRDWARHEEKGPFVLQYIQRTQNDPHH